VTARCRPPLGGRCSTWQDAGCRSRCDARDNRPRPRCLIRRLRLPLGIRCRSVHATCRRTGRREPTRPVGMAARERASVARVRSECRTAFREYGPRVLCGCSADDRPVVCAGGRGAMGCKAPRQPWHVWHLRQRGCCKLQNLQEVIGFKSHPLRQLSPLQSIVYIDGVKPVLGTDIAFRYIVYALVPSIAEL
jgi:hypothetical protein